MTAPVIRGQQVSGNGATASAGTLVVGWNALSSGTAAAGDRIVADVSWQFNGTTLTTPVGWTLELNPTGLSGNKVSRFSKILSAGDITAGNQTFTFSAAAVGEAVVNVYTGGVTLGTTVSTNTTTATPAVTTTQTNTEVLTSYVITHATLQPGTVAFATGTTDTTSVSNRAANSNVRITSGRVTTTTTGSYSSGTATVTGNAAATTQGIATEIMGVAAAGTTTYSMAGAARSDRAIVVGKLSGATSVRLGVSTSATMTSPSPTFATAIAPDSNGEVRYDFTGLTANTKYYYRFYDTPSGGAETDIGSGLGSATSGSFRTRPTSTGTSDVTIALGSCCLTATAQSAVAFDDAVTWDPHYVLHLGDAYYNGNSANTLASQHRTLWETQVSTVAKWKAMLGGVAVDYINSDHELNPDDTDTNTTNASSFNDFYKATIPARLVDTATSPTGKYRSWIDSGIRFIMLDIRTTDRSPGANTDNTSKTMLGATQKAWLKKELLDGDGVPTILKVLISDVPFFANSGADKWSSSYNTELTELLNFAVYNQINLDLLHGDSHRIAVDATHNAWGIPVICGSPWSQNGGGAETNGLWDSFFDNSGGAVSQYMRLTYSRPTADSVTRVASGWDAITATQKLTQTKTWARQPAPGIRLQMFA